MLLSWLPLQRSMVLLYRGTRDGFAASAFHSRCDGHVNTLTLVRTTQNDIHGGFTPLPWNSNMQWVGGGAGQSFVFTLVSSNSKFTAPARQCCIKPQYEIYGNPRCGALFGGATSNSLHISDNSNNVSSSCRAIGAGDYEAAGPSAETVTFTVAEIEVYQLVP
eukprot:Pompholyxophrys_punicea_v1_NODE_1442_length_718_cov_2.734540.p1 type:complete len:163 gc:universal NODE_1442_length_718_cov_2.734540:573-85(-)